MNKDNLNPEGRVILITGANRGIGRVTAERLYDEGYTLSLGARSPEALLPICESRGEQQILPHEFEARDEKSAENWVTATIERFGRIDGVVNNAGIMHPFSVERGDEAALDEMWEVNVKGPLRLVRAAFPHLKRCGTGRVVNIVSLSGKRVASEDSMGYAMSKYAASAFTRGVNHSGWEEGIRATAICPGLVATDMTAEVKTPPAKEMIQPEAVAEVVALVLRLSNTASVAEVPINCQFDRGL